MYRGGIGLTVSRVAPLCVGDGIRRVAVGGRLAGRVAGVPIDGGRDLHGPVDGQVQKGVVEVGDLRRGQRGGLVVGTIVSAPVAAVSLGVCHL